MSKYDIPKEWIMKRAHLEDDQEIGAGNPGQTPSPTPDMKECLPSPCPHCGYAPEMIPGSKVYVRCLTRDCAHYNNPCKLKEWNTRSSESSLQHQLDLARGLATYLAESIRQAEELLDHVDPDNRTDTEERIIHHFTGVSIGCYQKFGQWLTRDGWSTDKHPLLPTPPAPQGDK